MKLVRKFISVLVAFAMLGAMVPPVTFADTYTRNMEKLDRGLVAMKTDSGIYLTWRLLGTEAYDTTFDVYRDNTLIATAISDSTNYLDAGGSMSSVYKVVSSAEDASSVTKTATPFASGENYIEIPVAPIEDYDKTYYGTEYLSEYKIHDASVGDLDGDGEYEIIVKREANHHHAGEINQTTKKLVKTFNHMYLEAYKLNGDILWRIDMGENMPAMTEFVFLVYDFNKDGSAEIACKTAPGTKDGTGQYITAASTDAAITVADNTVSYRDEDGHVAKGPEYLTLFDGRNGKALDTISYPIPRGTDAENTMDSTWGDDYGHRAEKCMGSVSYFDGVNPGIALWRGIYTRIAAANISVNNSTNRMTVVNQFDTCSGKTGYKSGYEKYEGQGNHSLACGDVDGDGKDEFISGGLCLDDDLKPLWCTYRGHGDAHHLAEYDPTNNSLEYLTVQEHGGGKKITNDFGEEITIDYGMTLMHASDGKEMYHNGASGDTGRGVMTNVGAGGYFQFWGAGVKKGTGKATDSDSDPLTDNTTDTYGFEDLDYSPASYNFPIFWDGDVYSEMFDSYDVSTRDFRPSIFNYNTSTGKDERIFYNNDTVTINDTKSAPLLQADIFGDWREELILKTSDDMAMRIYTTNISTTNKLYTLMHDALYRQGVALQNQYYNQPPHISYYVTEKTDPLYQDGKYDKRSVKPNIQTVEYTASAPAATAAPVKGAITSRSGSYLIDEDGDYYRAINDTSMTGNEWKVTTSGVGRRIMMSTTNDADYLKMAESKRHIKGYSGKFLLFSANGVDTTFETKSSGSVSGTGKLSFSFMLPSTYSDNGSFAYGNAPTTMYVGDGTNKALKFTLTPNVTNGYVESAELSVNGTNVCSYSSLADAQEWTSVECATDNSAKKAYIAVTKGDGKVYTAEVDYADSGCGALCAFGVDASKYYGTVALDAIKLHATSSLEKPSAGATASYSPVSFTPYTPKTSEHFYELDLGNLTSGTITQKVKSTETKSEASSYNVANFRNETKKTSAIPELDGWGYVHAAYDNTIGRQTSAGVDVDNNAVVINGTNNVGGAKISFIPKNVAGLEIPSTGTLTYKFTAAVTTTSESGTVNYGFTSSNNGSMITAVDYVRISDTVDKNEKGEKTDVQNPSTAEIVLTYNQDTKAYSISVDGVEQKSGTSEFITGIFAASVQGSYTNGQIRNLTLDGDASSEAKKLTSVSLGAAHTATSAWGQDGSSYTNVDQEKQYFNNYHASLWAGCAFAAFNLDDTVKSAQTIALSYVVQNTTTKDRTFDIYYLTKDVDITKDLKASRADMFQGDCVKLLEGVSINASATQDYICNVKDAVDARLAAGSKQITFMFTAASAGANLYGSASDYAPELLLAYDASAIVPTLAPTLTPTEAPTLAPTLAPTASPTATPTAVPTATPTIAPTATPTIAPTASPTTTPTTTPIATAPAATPTTTPTSAPTGEPVTTEVPTSAPTSIPTSAPTSAPTSIPTEVPTTVPTLAPTDVPYPAVTPTAVPITEPTSAPTDEPSNENVEPVGDYINKIVITRVKGENGLSLVISPKSDEALPEVTLYTVIYNADHTLKSVVPTICNAGEDGTIVVPLSEPQTEAGEYYKLMLWDTEQSPLISVLSAATTDIFE